MSASPVEFVRHIRDETDYLVNFNRKRDMNTVYRSRWAFYIALLLILSAMAIYRMAFAIPAPFLSG